jgi:hypothetical protein
MICPLFEICKFKPKTTKTPAAVKKNDFMLLDNIS